MRIDMIEQELWKPIEGFEGLYEVSNLGRVKHLTDGKIRLGCRGNTIGYYYVGLYKDKKQYVRSVHKLVADAFIPNPKALPFINHKDEDPGNNRVDNLEWCTATYNSNYGSIREKHSKSLGRRRQVIIYDKAGNEVAKCDSVNDAAAYIGVTRSFITKALHGKAKTCKGYIVKGVRTRYEDLPEAIKQKALEYIPLRNTYTHEHMTGRLRKYYAEGYYNSALEAVKYIESVAPELVDGMKKELGLADTF